ncbi:SOS response-associated peptidase [Mycoplasmatota bacterium]|nr:SOS response-associated peptidase [Mycoplasmatota bacterium]
MCGRFTLAVSAKQLSDYVLDRYHIDDFSSKEKLPKFNVAPGSEIISILHDTKKYRIGSLKWGFVPSFAKDDVSFQMINAKAETLFDKPSFKKASLSQRCVVLADSFYEWDKTDKNEPPRRILTTDQKIFPMAAIWNTFIKDDGTKVHTVAIVTTKSNDMMSQIHDRMPVILNKKGEDVWLNPMNQNPKDLKKILIPYQSHKMKMYKVSKKINASSYDFEDALIEIEDDETLFD